MEDQPSEADIDDLVQKLVVYNFSKVEKTSWKKFAFFIRGKQDEILGGIVGETYWGWLFIKYLWIEESLRSKGLGRHLMELAEREAVKRECRHVYLDTFEFQALDFYEKLGYRVFGILEDFPQGHKRYFLQKRDLK